MIIVVETDYLEVDFIGSAVSQTNFHISPWNLRSYGVGEINYKSMKWLMVSDGRTISQQRTREYRT